ncbi:MAG TPA: DegT/DnrJ/EryC1/StrS family aminotransferase [Planctomycetaceae bacterium]|nr:DegT/DnrJ/EryC1/StrS family aminotransferase [Planctomycetaceae bacterium]
MTQKTKLVHIVTSPMTAWAFLRGQLRFMKDRGFDVTLISAPGWELDEIAKQEDVQAISLPMLREPAPFRDGIALTRLTALLRRLSPQIVHCGTPKACLLGGLAARLAGVPARVMTLHGMRTDGLAGRKQSLMLQLERLSCRSAQRIYCVSESLRSRAVELRLAPESKLRVLGHGTANGIDVERFSRTESLLERSQALREQFAIPAGTPVIGFVGRLVRDKGVGELVTAFGELQRDFPNVRLLLVGPLESYDGLDPQMRSRITTDPQIIHTGFLEDTAAAYPLMTLLALPTYREGFPYVPMEAAAMGLPVVATRVTGCVDAVVDGQTGTLVPPRDAAALAKAIAAYLKDSALCERHGVAGRERVERDFRPEPIWQSLYEEYSELLGVARSPLNLEDAEAARAPAPLRRPRDSKDSVVIRRLPAPASAVEPQRIYLSAPHMSGKEQEYIQEAFAANWVAPVGPHIDRFEAEFAEKIGVKHAVAVSSGTAAMHLVIRHLELKPDEEVFCSTGTFAASVNPVVYEQGAPVFIDSDPATWNLDCNLLSEELERCARRGKLPRAVIAVDLYGQCADWDSLRAICDSYAVPLIEDAAEALGATSGGKPAGSFGWANIFSFNGNKIITTSGGGMLATNDSALASRARYLATQARDPAPHYEHSAIGYNYRLSNLLAGVGRAQLAVLDERVAARRAIFDQYQLALGSEPGISFMPEAPYGYSTRWLSCVLIDAEQFGASREDVRLYLESHNIEARPVWKPMHKQPVFEHCRYVGGDVAEQLFADGLCLPSGSALTPPDLDRVICAFLSVPRRPARRSLSVTVQA